MPGRVRFSSTNTYHSPPPPPLMSPSSPSAASSSGPLTPPSLPYANFPGPTPFVPQYTYHSKKPSGRAHTLIASSNTPLLNYDISFHPSSLSTQYQGLSSAGLHEPAVYPPQSSITLVTGHLPWSIVVPASNGSYVTVTDVLHALYSALRVNVTTPEFSALGSQKFMDRASTAYRTRYQRLRGRRGYAEEKQQGIKRVDFLMGCTTFRGISPTSRGSGVWQLHTS